MSLFITFEGPDGSGKTTQFRLLADALTNAGRSILRTREPGGTRIGNGIRSLVLDVDYTEMSPRAETLLFNAARAQLVDEVIRPALAAGQIVLCDRYADSTLAYQGYGYGQDQDELRTLICYATGGLVPSLTVYLDIAPEDGLRRKLGDTKIEWNRLDAKKLAFHRRVHSGYLQMAAEEPHRWLVVDATQPIEQVHREILAAVEMHLCKEREDPV